MTYRIPTQTVIGISSHVASHQQVLAAVQTASVASGTPFATMVASATLESGLNPAAKAPGSTASGLFQFTEQTWLSTVKQFGASHGMATEAAAITQRNGRLTVDDPVAKQRILNQRFDPTIASSMAGDHLANLASGLSQKLGYNPDAAEIYTAHFLGATGGAQMLQAAVAAPTRLASDVLPTAAAANPTAFTNADGSPRTTAQFVARIRDRVTQAIADVGSGVPTGTAAIAAQGTGGNAASPPETGATGWSTRTPRLTASASERQMAASLVGAFTRLDSASASARTSHAKHAHGVPTGLVSGLGSTAGAGSAAATSGVAQ